MFWSSLTIAVTIVCLVVAVFSLMRAYISSRSDNIEQEETLIKLRLESQSVNSATRHFKHDLKNFLVGISLAQRMARVSLSDDDPEKVEASLETASEEVRRSLEFVTKFGLRPDEESPVTVNVGQVVLDISQIFIDMENEVSVNPSLLDWYVKAPHMTLTVLIGNLIKNATECSNSVRVDREGDSLRFTNPISPGDLDFLKIHDVFESGVSSKGPKRGIGLSSVKSSARICNAEVSYEITEEDTEPHIIFRVVFQGGHETSPKATDMQ